MERLQDEGLYGYRATPVGYPISDNNRPATYDQFISLRDTLVYSNKYYGSSAGRSLIIGTKLDGTPTNTIEIWEPNIVNQRVAPDGTVANDVAGEYVEPSSSAASCTIKKKGRYRLQHKEQFNSIPSTITRIHSYILQHKSDSSTQPRAVFDWEWNTVGEIKRMTAFGYIECDLDKGDWLELKVEDQNDSDIMSSMAPDSNRRMVEYIDLAYNI